MTPDEARKIINHYAIHPLDTDEDERKYEAALKVLLDEKRRK